VKQPTCVLCKKSPSGMIETDKGYVCPECIRNRIKELEAEVSSLRAKAERPALDDGWHLVYDPSDGILLNDPTGADHWFIFVHRGEVNMSTPKERGFHSIDDFRKRMAARLNGQLEALNRPALCYERKEEDIYHRLRQGRLKSRGC